MSPPLVSVILNFYDPRGKAEHIASWTREQTLPGDQFEVIAVTTASRSSLAEEIRSYLRPQDQLLCLQTDCPFELYAPAVAASRGSLLFFSEDHCLAEPDCLEHVVRFMAEQHYAGASVRWGNINRNAIGRMEQLTSERDFSTWFAEDHWNKLRIRGFVLTRESYEHVGGFRAEYKNFSEAVLSAELHDSGHKIGYLDQGGVTHINTSTFAELFENVWKYSWNECVFCTENEAEFCERYFADVCSFLRENCRDPDAARWTTRSLGRAWRRQLRAAPLGKDTRALTRLWMRSLMSSIFGTSGDRYRAYLKLFAARLRYEFWRFSERRRYQAFEDYWQRGTQCARADYISRNACSTPRRLSAPSWNGVDIPAIDAIGVYPAESYQGDSFCWTRPTSILWFDLEAGDYQVTLDTAALRGSDCRFGLTLFWNEHLLPTADVGVQDGKISFQVTPTMLAAGVPQRLTMIAAPIRPRGREQRWLGVPLRSVKLEAQDVESHESLRRSA